VASRQLALGGAGAPVHLDAMTTTAIIPAITRLLARPHLQRLLGVLDPVAPGGTRVVGGAVRDALLGRQAPDIDLATVLLPQQVVRACEDAGLKVVPTGIDHGTVTVVVDGQPLEVTTLRRDVETDGRRAVVAYTDSWAEDAARRDFRLNALYCDATGTIHDPTGEGIADARAGRIVFVGDPATRIREDALRILRFFRFQAWHGRGSPDPHGLAACAAGAGLLAGLSAERVWKELKRLLEATHPGATIQAMAATGILPAVLPESDGSASLLALLDIETSHLLDTDPMQRLMALLPRDTGVMRNLAGRLKMSREEADRLAQWAADGTRIVSWLSAREVRAALYRLGVRTWLDRVRLAWAQDLEPRRVPQWRALQAMASGYVRPVFPISGSMVMEAGVRRGPTVGAVLEEVERWWIESDFTDDTLSLIERLKAVVQGMG
jgi:poly(A) polymerase